MVFPRRERGYFVEGAEVGLQTILMEQGPHFLLSHLLGTVLKHHIHTVVKFSTVH